jgi:hypothetical protein
MVAFWLYCSKQLIEGILLTFHAHSRRDLCDFTAGVRV